MVVASFMVDAGFMGWCSLIAIVMPLPDSGTTEIATAFSGTRAARNSAATLSGKTGGTVDCPWAGAARSDNAATQEAGSARNGAHEKPVQQGNPPSERRGARRDPRDYPHERQRRTAQCDSPTKTAPAGAVSSGAARQLDSCSRPSPTRRYEPTPRSSGFVSRSWSSTCSTPSTEAYGTFTVRLP